MATGPKVAMATGLPVRSSSYAQNAERACDNDELLTRPWHVRPENTDASNRGGWLLRFQKVSYGKKGLSHFALVELAVESVPELFVFGVHRHPDTRVTFLVKWQQFPGKDGGHIVSFGVIPGSEFQASELELLAFGAPALSEHLFEVFGFEHFHSLFFSSCNGSKLRSRLGPGRRARPSPLESAAWSCGSISANTHERSWPRYTRGLARSATNTEPFRGCLLLLHQRQEPELSLFFSA